jgi:hypothetical protein
VAAEPQSRAPESLAGWFAGIPAATLARPVLGDPLAAYRHLPKRTDDPRAALVAWAEADNRAGITASVLRAENKGLSACACWRPSPFESECVRRRIAHLTALAGWGSTAAAGLAAEALAAALDTARASGIELILAKAARDDASATHALGRAGFRTVARKLTYFYLPAYRTQVAPIRSRHVVRPFRPQDLDHLVALGASFRHSQYRELPGVAGGDVDRLYESWIERACRGEFADAVLVAETEGQAVAFSSFKARADALAVSGLRVLGQGLGAVEPRASGALISLILKMQELVDRGAYDAAEFDFYEENAAVRRALERLGFRPVAASSVLCLEL